MSRVVVEDLEKRYPQGALALAGLSLEVADGELLTVVGPSGCGKTTLLRLIAGLETPTRGSIALDDRTVDRLPPRERDVAMVFQNPVLYPHLTVYENLAFPLRLRRVPRKAIRHRALEAAAVLGLEPLLGRSPRQLSGGETQRAALGRALVRRPRCYLFDEPLAALDAPLRWTLRGALRRLHSKLKITTLYVTHDQEEAMTLGDRVAVLRAGRLEQLAAPLEAYQRPANRFVAGFLGSPPMNFLEGRVARGDRGWRLEHGGVALPLPDEAAPALAGREGQTLVVGARPEALRLLHADLEGLPAEVAAVEPLGDRCDLRLETTGNRGLAARVEAATAPRAGEIVRVTIDPRQARLFAADAEGRRLW